MSKQKPMTLFSDIYELMTLKSAVSQRARGPMTAKSLSILKDVCMVCDHGQVVWIGKRQKIPSGLRKLGLREVSLKANVFPGFIDCHTHSVFAGDRSNEFELRNQGVSYQEIARRGGGILSTVKATRKASQSELEHSLGLRLNRFAKQGVTTVEVKSGYGLNKRNELKILESIKGTKHAVKTVSTFLGAHALGPEYKSYDEYLEALKDMLKAIAKKKLSERVDIFIEKGYFNIKQARDYLNFAKTLGFQVTVHADQLTRTGATSLCVEMESLSADHAILVNKKDLKKLKSSEVTCVLLPAADFYIHCPYPPARKMIDDGVRVALATDFNPGSSPTQNIQLVGLLARLKMKMSLPEVFVAQTLGGAYALGMEEYRGALLPGFEADFFVSKCNWKDFFYDSQSVDLESVWINAKRVSKKYLSNG